MKENNFLEEQRRRQRELVEARKAKQDPTVAPVQQEREAEELTFGQKAQNFWFYNKWFVIIGVFVAIMLVITISQCATREKFDQQVVLFSYDAYMPAEIDALEEELSKYGEDLNGDGEVKVQIIDCSYGKEETSDAKNAKKQKLTAILASNSEALTFIVSDETFEYLEKEHPGFFVNRGLDSKSGRAGALSEEFYKTVNESEYYDKLNEAVEEGEEKFTLPEGLMVARRIADENTLIGQQNGIEERIAAADILIKKIAE